MRYFHWMAAMLFLSVFVANVSLRAEEKEPSQQPDAAELEKLWAEFATPGAEHEQLKRLAGDWTTEVTSYYGNPENPTVTKGTANFRMILGGRYLRQRFNGEFDGRPFTGVGISGYDKALKEYVGIWIDSAGTGIMHTKGTYDVASHTLTEIGESSSPQGNMKMRMTSKYIDNDNFVFTMYVVMPDAEQKMMEIKYKRDK